MKTTEPFQPVPPGLAISKVFHPFHAAFVARIFEYLSQKLPDTYDAWIESAVAFETIGGDDRRFPDVHVASIAREPAAEYVTPAAAGQYSFVLPAPERMKRNLRFLHLKTTDGELITTIEVLSPINKTGEGFKKYREKQEALIANGVNLVEIDLLQRGTRRFEDARVAAAPYVLTVTRAATRQTEVWTVERDQPLPNLPVPLLPEDGDVILETQEVFGMTFRMGRFGGKIARLE